MSEGYFVSCDSEKESLFSATVGWSSGLKFCGIILQARTPREVIVHDHFSDIN